MAEKLAMQTKDLSEENVAKIAALFPDCVTESVSENGSIKYLIDFEALKRQLSGSTIPEGKERYVFTWPGKSEAQRIANTPSNKALRPQREKSVDFDNTENIYIEGDNLEALKLLRETYLGKINLIFIDPPYNTGNDYIYSDNYSMNESDYAELSGDYDDYGNKLILNTTSNGRFHSDWLNMMYPRLMLAKDLLSDDGSIFISIDYNEVGNLKKIMDEIFGESNFQREIIWRIGWLSGYKTTAPNFIRNHDTILFYSKNHTKLKFIKKYINNQDFKQLVKKEPKLTKKLDELGLSSKQQTDLLNFINYENRPDKYPIEDTWNSNEYDDLNSIAIVSFSGEKISKVM